MTHPDLDAEQRYFDALYAALDHEIESAEARLRDVRRAPAGGLPQARFEREAFAAHLEGRVAALRAHRRDDLCFGRIDRVDGGRLYIGRLGLSGDDHEPLLIDWRAPAAAPFYQATPREPLDIARRRHYLTRGRRIVAIEDDVLDAEAMSAGEAESLRGEAALQYAMGTARTGRMREIAATIQREQDQIIRAPFTPTVFVQGGPGTGKTVVALHRAAYLLYTHRRRLSASDVLVVGPNPVFLRYIEQVLPSLGETGADLTSVAGVYARREWRPEERDIRRVKARPVMAEVIRRAIATRQRPLPRSVEINVEGERVVLTPDDTEPIVRRGRRRAGRHNPVAAYVHDRLVRLVWERAGPAAANVVEFEDFRADTLTDPRFRRVSQRIWPVLTPEQLLHDLFGFPALLQDAASGTLDPDDAELLRRPRSASAEDVAWTVADAALLDEAAEQLGPVPPELVPGTRRELDLEAAEEARAEAEYTRQLLSGLGAGIVPREVLEQRAGLRGGEADEETVARVWRYAVIDESQDVSPMEWRMVGRHAPRRAATVVGDLAQGSEPWSAAAWGDVRAALGAPPESTIAELSINYRTPQEVAGFASEILAVAAPTLASPRSVRSVPGSLVIRPVTADMTERAADEALRLREELADGLVALIAAPGSSEEVRAVLERRVGRSLAAPGDPAILDGPVAVMTPTLAKGLEFDAVVLVDPAAIAGECGWSALYVSATRATRRLVVLHTGDRPFPD